MDQLYMVDKEISMLYVRIVLKQDNGMTILHMFLMNINKPEKEI